MSGLTSDAVKYAARGRWRDILTAAGIPSTALDERHHPCPKCGGTDRFRFIDPDAGACYCNQCFNQKSGDGFAALAWIRGCTFWDAVQFAAGCIGLSPASTATKKPKGFRPDSEIVATYDYHDAAGKIVHRTVKYANPKDFRQRRPDPERPGKWLYKLGKDFKTVLYHLPEIIDAPANATIYLAEGEKDADNIRRGGFVATTVPMGANYWRQHHSELLRGRHVVIVPDVDVPNPKTGKAAGWEHVVKVGNALLGIAASVRVLELPNAFATPLVPKWDVSDWIDAGGTKAQFLEAVAKAKPWVKTDPPPAAPECIRNSEVIETDGKKKTEPLPMQKIQSEIDRMADSWPRRIGSALFVHEGEQISWLGTPAAMMGFLGSKTGAPPVFSEGAGLHTRADVFAERQRTATAYSAVEILPHEPPMEGHYYACETPAPGNGENLAALLAMFSPATDIDGDLIKAAILTMVWGGSGGFRPAFLVTADEGRGCGKSTLPRVFSELFKGAIEVSPNEDFSIVKQRLLSPESQTKRIVVLDNVKTMRFSWGEMEGLMTAGQISGKMMYVGEAVRPNNLTYFITLNGASLSTDFAQRVVILKLSRPAYSATWFEDVKEFIELHRMEIIADAIAALREAPTPLERYSRWGSWEREVLSRLPEPAEAQRVIAERQAAADIEAEEADVVEEYFASQLEALGYDVEEDRIFIPSEIARDWVNNVKSEKESMIKTSKALTQQISESKDPKLSVNPTKNRGRGFIWTGSNATGGTYVQCDIREKIKFQWAKDAF